MSDIDALTEPQRIALEFVAIVERKTLAQVRRDALARQADLLLTNDNIHAAVHACLRYRRENGVNRPVTKLRRIQ